MPEVAAASGGIMARMMQQPSGEWKGVGGVINCLSGFQDLIRTE